MNIIVEKEESIKNIRISNIHWLGDIDINIKAERFIRTSHSSYINLIKDISREASSDHHLWILKSHQGSITGISCLLATSSPSMSIFIEKKKLIQSIIILYLNLLYVSKSFSPWDLSHQKDPISIFIVIDNIRVDKFIRTLRPSYINLIKGIIRRVPSGDHQQSKSHQAASSMNTSEKHIIIVQGIMVEVEGQDIQTYCIYPTIFGFFISKYSVISESIIDNYIHNILVTSHQREALCIPHLCSFEWRDTGIFIAYPSSLGHHLIIWSEEEYNIIKNVYINSIIHRESAPFICNLYIKAVHGLSSMTNGISIIGFIDSKKQSLEDIVIILNIHYNIHFHLEYSIHHLESCNTFNIQSCLALNIKFSISYLNQFIIEHYSTINETNAIRNVTTGMTSYMDIKVGGLYIIVGNSDISVRITISILELISSILERRPIITAGERADIKIIKEEVVEISMTSIQLIKVIMLYYVAIIN